MPRVGKTHFAYTPAGRNKAEAFAKKTGQKVVHAKKGKWIQEVNKSIKKKGTKGKCTPITKPGCKGRAKTLAKTFKKMAKKNKKKTKKA